MIIQISLPILAVTYTLYTYINGAVVLVDLDVQVVANCGEVIRLRHVAKPVVLPIEVYQRVRILVVCAVRSSLCCGDPQLLVLLLVHNYYFVNGAIGLESVQ